MSACSEQLPSDFLKSAKALHRRTPPIDGHNGVPWHYRKQVKQALSKVDIIHLQPGASYGYRVS